MNNRLGKKLGGALTCPNPDCRKQAFLTRKEARGYAKAQLPSESFSIYKCGEYWHYGHTPYSIKRGMTDRRGYVRRAR